MRCLFATVLGITAGLVCGIARAQDYRPDFDPGSLKGPHAGTPNQILVLATPHLSGLPKSFKAADLQSLIDRLAAWQPQAIAIEAVSGPQCDFMRNYPDRYRESTESYCWDPSPAQQATGLNVPAATAEAERMLAKWPQSPTAADRRRLAALFLAGGERSSALVQWLRLSESDRHAGDGLDDALVTFLNTLRERSNE